MKVHGWVEGGRNPFSLSSDHSVPQWRSELYMVTREVDGDIEARRKCCSDTAGRRERRAPATFLAALDRTDWKRAEESKTWTEGSHRARRETIRCTVVAPREQRGRRRDMELGQRGCDPITKKGAQEILPCTSARPRERRAAAPGEKGGGEGEE